MGTIAFSPHRKADCGMRVVLILSILLVATVPAVAEQAAPQVCFTPGGKCTDLIVREIGTARQSILVQAYSFTSVPILSRSRRLTPAAWT
jgi:hypothetical protein